MTMPERSLAASAAPAEPPRIPSTGLSPSARADHDRMANAIRALAMDAVEKANSGHPGLPMGAADIATVLFTRFLKFDPADPALPDREITQVNQQSDRLVVFVGLPLLDVRCNLIPSRFLALPQLVQIARTVSLVFCLPSHSFHRSLGLQ